MEQRNRMRQKVHPAPSSFILRSSLVQRHCACGGIASIDDLCEQCRSQRLSGQMGTPGSLEPLWPASPGHDVPGTSHQPIEAAQQPSEGSRFGHDFRQIPVHAAVSGPIQAKLSISQPGDRYEQEADQVAEQVMRMPDSDAMQNARSSDTPSPIHIQRFSPQSEEVHRQMEAEEVNSEPLEEEEEEKSSGESMQGEKAEETLQTKESPGHIPTMTPELHIRINSLRGGGQPLDPATRAYMEPRFGHDFSQVRIHSDERAAETARAVNALAYTVGRDVVFGAGQYSPGTVAGRRLMAHELTHVVQQAIDHQIVARQPVTQYQTKPVSFTIEQNINESYWEQRVLKTYPGRSRIYIDPVTERFRNDPEERDAVLSVLWRIRPTIMLATEVTKIVSIPARSGIKASKPLVYRFVFKPKKKVEIHFVAEGDTKMGMALPPPRPDFTPSNLGETSINFPENNPDKYWEKHPEEKKQVFKWIETNTKGTFKQILTTEVTSWKGKKTINQKSSFFVEGTKQKSGTFNNVRITWLGPAQPAKVELAPDYRNKDLVDLELESAQTQLDPKKKDRLGKIKLPTNLPKNELYSVKFTIWNYFKRGTRNAEVDVIIPIANTKKRVYYTLRFRPKTNDVDVDRIGEEQKGGKVDSTQLNIKRVHGYADNSKDPTTFRSWLQKRYRGEKVSGKTVKEMSENINKIMQAQVGTKEWLKKNYGIEILDREDISNFSVVGKHLQAAKARGVKSFEPEELKILEFALETMSDEILARIKGTRMVRAEKKGGAQGAKRESAGHAMLEGNEKTVIIYDAANKSDPYLFLGGTGGVRPQSTLYFVHELGHIVGFQANIEKKFIKFWKKNKGKIKPITWYALEKPEKDFFPEAFALFHTDPEWMRTNVPVLYKWFEENL